MSYIVLEVVINLLISIMKKIIKKSGNSLIISFSPEDLKIYDMDLGDVVEFTITSVTRGTKIINKPYIVKEESNPRVSLD